MGKIKEKPPRCRGNCLPEVGKYAYPLGAFDFADESMLNLFMNHPWLFASPHVNRMDRLRTDSRAQDMKSNDEIPSMNRFGAVQLEILTLLPRTQTLFFWKQVVIHVLPMGESDIAVLFGVARSNCRISHRVGCFI